MSDDLVGQRAAVVSRRIEAPPWAVWAVLADGWMYANWVVGASRVRDVDAHWPAVGAKIHHSFGVWPAVIDDTSEVLQCTPERELVVKARGWPAGEAHVRLVLEARGADTTLVSIQEDVAAGPAVALPLSLRQLAIAPRNTEALRRLGYLAQGRAREQRGGRQESTPHPTA